MHIRGQTRNLAPPVPATSLRQPRHLGRKPLPTIKAGRIQSPNGSSARQDSPSRTAESSPIASALLHGRRACPNPDNCALRARSLPPRTLGLPSPARTIEKSPRRPKHSWKTHRQFAHLPAEQLQRVRSPNSESEARHQTLELTNSKLRTPADPETALLAVRPPASRSPKKEICAAPCSCSAGRHLDPALGETPKSQQTRR